MLDAGNLLRGGEEHVLQADAASGDIGDAGRGGFNSVQDHVQRTGGDGLDGERPSFLKARQNERVQRLLRPQEDRRVIEIGEDLQARHPDVRADPLAGAVGLIVVTQHSTFGTVFHHRQVRADSQAEDAGAVEGDQFVEPPLIHVELIDRRPALFDGQLNDVFGIVDLQPTAIPDAMLMSIDEARDKRRPAEVHDDCPDALVARHIVVAANGQDRFPTNGEGLRRGVGWIHRENVGIGEDHVRRPHRRRLRTRCLWGGGRDARGLNRSGRRGGRLDLRGGRRAASLEGNRQGGEGVGKPAERGRSPHRPISRHARTRRRPWLEQRRHGS